jgi:hypothetical protein
MSDAAVAVANLVYRYAECVDLGDFEGVGELFADATYRAVTDGRVATMSGTQVTATLRSMVLTGEDGTPGTKHVTTNLIVDVDDEAGTATCRSYYTVLQVAPGLGLEPIIAGRYHDAFERVEGRWRFTDRLIYSDLIGDLRQHLRTNPY